MLLKLLFTDVPELFYTINFMMEIRLGRLTITMAAGLFLAIAALIIFLLFHFKKILDEKKYNAVIIGLIVLARLPLYLNFTYNNLYDLLENLKDLEKNVSGRRILRVCRIDGRQNSHGIFCRLFSFATFAKNNLQAGIEVMLIFRPVLDGMLTYYLYPELKINDQADYILLYFPDGYFYKNEILYEKQGNQNLIIGKYKMLNAKSEVEFILKKE